MAKSAAAAGYGNDSMGDKLKSFPERTRSFISDVRTEMKHVSYPSGKEVRATTIVVVITVALFGLFFWLVDLGLGRAIDSIFRYFAR
jgi:preprotein translocase subunit SecE